MESYEPTAAQQVEDVRGVQQRLARAIAVPPGYDEALSAAVAALVVGAALANAGPRFLGVLLVLASAVVIGWQVRRFRSHNGVWVSSLRKGATVASTVFAAVVVFAAVIGASAAGSREHWWLVAVLAVVAAVLYWLASKWWMRSYHRDNDGL